MAMKFAEKFLNMMTLNDVDDYDEYDEEYESYDDYDENFEDDNYDDEDVADSGRGFADIKKPSLSFRHKNKDTEDKGEPQGTSEKRVIPFIKKQGDIDVVKVVKPQEFNEAQTIVEHLREGRTIVVNLEGIEISQAQRIIDFVGGASFIIDGSLRAISNNIFIVAPSNIEVSGDLKTEILNDAMLSPEIGTI